MLVTPHRSTLRHVSLCWRPPILPKPPDPLFPAIPWGKKNLCLHLQKLPERRVPLLKDQSEAVAASWLPSAGGDAEAANRSAQCTRPKNPWEKQNSSFFSPPSWHTKDRAGGDRAEPSSVSPQQKANHTFAPWRLGFGGWQAEQELPPSTSHLPALIFSQISILKPHRGPLRRQLTKKRHQVLERASQEPMHRTRCGWGWGIPWLSPRDLLMWSPARDTCLEIPTSPQRSS